MNLSGRHFPVNWIDGMKINKSHFIDNEKAFTEQLKDTARVFLNPFNYGLLPAPGFGNSALKLWIEMEHQSRVHVKVIECKAVTMGGYTIDISDLQSNPVNLTAENPEILADFSNIKDSSVWVVLSVNPFKRVPIGEANPEEEPPRYPYSAPEYKISLIPYSQWINREPGPMNLIIGKIINENGRVYLSKDYIPPCTTVYSHPSLIEIHATMVNLLSRLEEYAVLIIQKIYLKDQQFPLAQFVKAISENIIAYLNGMLYSFRWSTSFEPPLYLIEKLSGLARVFKNSIEIRQGTGKEELLNYLVEWCDINQSQLENVIGEAIECEYQHIDLKLAMDKGTRFLKELVTLYQKLSELDYIGKKSEKAIFVKEEELKKEPPGRSRIGFFGM